MRRRRRRRKEKKTKKFSDPLSTKSITQNDIYTNLNYTSKLND